MAGVSDGEGGCDERGTADVAALSVVASCDGATSVG